MQAVAGWPRVTGVNIAKTERAALADLMDQVGPNYPTLCGEWDAHDLAVHLWIRETDPLGAPGILAKPLAGLTEKRSQEVKERWSFTELVDRIRRGPAKFSVFSIPGVDESANAVEFFIHHEDVRRAGKTPGSPRGLDAETEDWLWKRLKLMARAFYRRCDVGVVLERRSTDDAAGESEPIRAMAGSECVTVVGLPSEVMLYSYGRREQADVELIGEPGAVERFNNADLAI